MKGRSQTQPACARAARTLSPRGRSLLDHLGDGDLGVLLEGVHHEAVAPDVIHALENTRRTGEKGLTEVTCRGPSEMRRGCCKLGTESNSYGVRTSAPPGRSLVQMLRELHGRAALLMQDLAR